METRSRMSRSLHTNRDFEKLEPYEGKPSRTVLRGEEGSNALDLPDRTPAVKNVSIFARILSPESSFVPHPKSAGHNGHKPCCRTTRA